MDDHLSRQVQQNTDFRRVLKTTPTKQWAAMCIPAGDDIGAEHHPQKQTTTVVSGEGRALVGIAEHPIGKGSTFVVQPEVRHNVANTGKEPLKLLVIYEPPAHAEGEIDRTKADAARREGGTLPAMSIASEKRTNRVLGYVGDVNWDQYGGGPIYRTEHGDVLEYLEPSDEEGGQTEVYRVTLDKGVPSWGKIEDVARTTDQPVGELRKAFNSDDPFERAYAYQAWAGHYGWREFDSDPLVLSPSEVNRRYFATMQALKKLPRPRGYKWSAERARANRATANDSTIHGTSGKYTLRPYMGKVLVLGPTGKHVGIFDDQAEAERAVKRDECAGAQEGDPSAMGEGYRARAAEGPAEPMIPWLKVTRDPERYQQALEMAKAIGPIENSESIYNLLSPALSKEDQEVFLVVLMDVRRQLRGVAEVARGQRSAVTVGIADVMRVVVASGAETFVVCHNHPSSKAEPSKADKSLTEDIRQAFKPLGADCTFADHVIVGMGEYFSFADNKLHKVRKKR